MDLKFLVPDSEEFSRAHRVFSRSSKIKREKIIERFGVCPAGKFNRVYEL